jgi:ABC-type transporter Mla subunit MlaD
VSQINSAVSEINAVTQQVAANAEESASAATELESQAQTLRDTVGQFTLVSQAAPTSARGPRPRPEGLRSATRHPRPSAVRREPAFAGSAARTNRFSTDDEMLGGF